jgi:hypothetical protein
MPVAGGSSNSARKPLAQNHKLQPYSEFVAAKIAVPTDGNQPNGKQRFNIALGRSGNAICALSNSPGAVLQSGVGNVQQARSI